MNEICMYENYQLEKQTKIVIGIAGILLFFFLMGIGSAVKVQAAGVTQVAREKTYTATYSQDLTGNGIFQLDVYLQIYRGQI